MGAVILIVIGFATEHAIPVHRARERAPVETRAIAAEPSCAPSTDSVWVADLKRAGSERWLVRADGTLCAPATNEREAADTPPLAEPAP